MKTFIVKFQKKEEIRIIEELSAQTKLSETELLYKIIQTGYKEMSKKKSRKKENVILFLILICITLLGVRIGAVLF